MWSRPPPPLPFKWAGSRTLCDVVLIGAKVMGFPSVHSGLIWGQCFFKKCYSLLIHCIVAPVPKWQIGKRTEKQGKAREPQQK